MTASIKPITERLIDAIEIPHQNPNPILQFNENGKLVFANIAAFSELELQYGDFQENPYVYILKQEILSDNTKLHTKELQLNNKFFLCYITPLHHLGSALTNVYAVDISEIKKYQKELKEEREHALEASRVKSEFLANMSHELRTPMNGVISLSELLAKMKLPTDAKKYAETILNSGQTLLTILNDILDISKVESGELVLEDNCFDFHRMLIDVEKLYMPMAKEKDINLLLNMTDDVPRLLKGDMGRIIQILRNLVGNAIKFTKYGEVEISVTHKKERERNEISIAVTDSGIGISAEKVESIFDKFTQADASVTREYGGTGLGLAITKQLVEMMGGSIHVKSKEGFGSTFYFNIPCTQANEGETPINAYTADVLEQDIRLHEDVSILAVDDTDMNIYCLEKILNDMGVKIIDKAHNGEEALALMSNVPYDIVFMDCMMPILDGYEATTLFREQEEDLGHPHRQIIIAMTANAMVGDKERSLKAGMDDYISKPIHTETIKAKLAKHLSPDRYELIDPEGLGTTEEDDILNSFLPAEDAEEINEHTSPQNKKLFNEEQLAMFTDHNTDIETEIIQMFIEQAELILTTLQTPEGQTQWSNHIHKLKGLAGNCGATTLFEICKNAEFSEDTEKNEWIKRIHHAYDDLMAYFNNRFTVETHTTKQFLAS